MGWTNQVTDQLIIGVYPQGPYRFIGPMVPDVLANFNPNGAPQPPYKWQFVDLWYYEGGVSFYFEGLAQNIEFGVSERVTGIYSPTTGVQLHVFENQGESAIYFGTDTYDTMRLPIHFRKADVTIEDTSTIAMLGAALATQIVACDASATPETWHTATLGGSWIPFPGQQVPRYRAMPDGTIMLDGDVKSSVAVNPGTVVLTLTGLYVPSSSRSFSVTGSGIPAGATLNMTSSGTLVLGNFTGPITVALMGLAGVRFPSQFLTP
jgi:hypothetical protein